MTPPGPKVNSEHGKGVKRTGHSDLLVRTPACYCFREVKEATNGHVAAREMEMKRCPEFLD